MPAIEPLEAAADRVARRVMFALEFLDPVTGRVVGDGLLPRVAGLPPPLKGHAGRFVWLESEIPVGRDIIVVLAIGNPMYGQPAAADLQFTIPANDDHSRPELFLKRVKLTITSRYAPPVGITGVASMVIEDQDFSAPVPDAACALAFFHDGDQRFTSSRRAASDAGGAFIAFADDLHDIVPRSAPPEGDADVFGWLVVTRAGAPQPVRFSGFLPLRRGRLTQLRNPISWAGLFTQPPDPPSQI